MKTPVTQVVRFLTKHRHRILSGLAILAGLIESLPEPPKRIRKPRQLKGPKQ